MRTQVLDMILLFNILRVSGTCCWWDTTISQWCAQEECDWLYDNTIEGVCYCAESSDCDVCYNYTSFPISFYCPENCTLIWGCFGIYCSCGFGGCDHPEESGCSNPVDANSHSITWGVSADCWCDSEEGVSTCCLSEELIKKSTSSVAKVLGLNDDQVTVKDYKLMTEDSYWFILYVIELGVGEFSWGIMEDLEWGRVGTIRTQIEKDLKIELRFLESDCLGLDENDPRDKSASSESASSDSTGTTVGIIVGVLVVVVLGTLLCYKYVWHMKSKHIL